MENEGLPESPLRLARLDEGSEGMTPLLDEETSYSNLGMLREEVLVLLLVLAVCDSGMAADVGAGIEDV